MKLPFGVSSYEKFIILIVFFLLLISLPANAQQISTVAEVYDFHIGDEFETRNFQVNLGSWYESFYYETVTNRYYSNDTLIYDWQIERKTRDNIDTNWIYSEYSLSTYHSNLDSLVNNGEIQYVYADVDLYNSRKINYKEYELPDNYIHQQRFVVGCGKTYDQTIGFGAGSSSSHLIYYKKGDEEWGEEVLVSINNSYDDKLVSIYPNPATDFVYIKSNVSNHISGSIYNSHCQLIKTFEFPLGINILDITRLKKGMYFITINCSARVVRKTIIKN